MLVGWVALGAQAIAPAPDALLNTPPAAMGIGDTDGDGYGDLVILTTGASIHVYAGGPNGVAGRTGQIGSPGGPFASGGSLVVLDVDGDGYDDALLAFQRSWSTYYGWDLLLHRGGPSGLRAPVAWQGFVDGGDAPHLAAGDLNGDGFGDLTYCAGDRPFGTPTCELLLGDANANLNRAQSFRGAAYGAPLHAAFTDLDGDGLDELAVDLNTNIGVWAGTTGAIPLAPTWILGFRAGRLAGADLDGDGFDDLWADERIVPGTPAGPGAVQAVLAGVTLPSVIASPDVDGDGADDLIAADPALTVGAYASAGLVGVVRSGAILPPVPGPWVSRGDAQERVGEVLAAGDLNGDGFGDRAFSTANYTVAVVYGP